MTKAVPREAVAKRGYGKEMFSLTTRREALTKRGYDKGCTKRGCDKERL